MANNFNFFGTIFIRFLKERSYYRKYVRNFNKNKNVKHRIKYYGFRNIDELLQEISIDSWVDYSFNWSETYEGSRFWDSVNLEWQDFVENNIL